MANQEEDFSMEKEEQYQEEPKSAFSQALDEATEKNNAGNEPVSVIPETIPHYKQGHDFPGARANEYRKHKTAMLVKMDTPFDCESREGTLRGQVGDYLAQDGHGGFYPISAEFHAENYEEVTPGIVPKTLHNSDVSGARKNVPDIEVVGDGDLFRLLAKASSESEGWMKSTKAMVTPHGCVIQVTTQQKNLDGTYSLAEALTYVPGVKLAKDGETRKLIKN